MRLIRLLTVLLPALSALCGCSSKAASADDVSPRQALRAPFDADSAYAYVARQVDFGPRIPATPAHQACARWIVDELRRHGADTVIVSRAPLTLPDGRNVVAVNILGRFNGKASPLRRVLLAAHYDTRPMADNDPDPANRTKPADGANDGASGVAVLLETARQLSLDRPDASVDLLFVDAEDAGRDDDNDSWCLGSQQWIQQMPYAFTDDDPAPLYGILLDMVGGKDARFHREYFSTETAPAVVQRIWRTARSLGLAGRFPDEDGGAIVDDHLWFSRAGIPSADIIESRNYQTASFPPTWHTLDDNLENIDPATLGDVGVVVNTIIRSETTR